MAFCEAWPSFFDEEEEEARCVHLPDVLIRGWTTRRGRCRSGRCSRRRVTRRARFHTTLSGPRSQWNWTAPPITMRSAGPAGRTRPIGLRMGAHATGTLRGALRHGGARGLCRCARPPGDPRVRAPCLAVGCMVAMDERIRQRRGSRHHARALAVRERCRRRTSGRVAGSAYLHLMQHLRLAVHAHPASQLAQDRRIADQSFYLPAVALNMSRRPDDTGARSSVLILLA